MSDTQVEVLYESARTRVVRIPAHGAGRGVIRKELRGADAVERCRREREILLRLAGVEGVARLAAGAPDDTTLLLVDEGDRSLADWLRAGRPPIGAVIDVAARLADVITAVHAAGVTHKDINPANVVLDGDRPVLIDFELATTAAEERPGFTHQNQVVGTLTYLAPEQTGRTGRAVDQRSDLYSFGATLYEMAAGRPPFTGTAPLQLLHDHLARRPARVTQHDPAVPPRLADLIDRLLEKEPDRRYQSAAGCAYDLRHLDDEQFLLGARDFPTRLSGPSHLVGRDAEIDTLRGALDEALAGRLRGLLVSGPSGVGKTALINELRPAVTAAGGWFVTGKFDQFRQDAAADGAASVYRALVRLLLSENEADLARLRAALGPALGANAGLLAGLVPELGPLLGVEPEEARGDQAEVQGRLIQAALALARTVVSPARPLVMVVDDLQWATATQIALLEALLTDDGMPGLLMIGAYREEEVDAAHPLSAVLSRWQRIDPPPQALRLRNLPADDLAELLAETLRMPADRAGTLAEVIAPRTGGNPFDTVELINSLRGGGVLTHTDEGWAWDAAAVNRWVGDRDIGDLLLARLERLSRPSRQLLAVMAALGGETSLGLLAPALAVTPAEVEARLAPALEDGLVVVHQDGDVHEVAFRHDRVQKAAYALTPARARRLVHLVLAGRLSGRPEFAAVAARQYLPAAGLITGEAERRRVAELFRSTAAALRMINAAAAERYVAAAVDLAPDGDPALLDRLRIDHHRALYSVGRPAEADALYAVLAGRLDPIVLAEPAGVQIESLTVRGRAADALDLGKELLDRLGFSVSDRPQQAGVDELRAWAAGLRSGDDLGRADVSEPATVAACRLVSRMMPPAFFSDHTTLVALVTTAQRIWAGHGPSAALVVPLAHSGIASIGFRDDYATGYRVLRHIAEVGEARGWEAETAAARFLASVSTTHWFEPVEHSVDLARRAFDALVRNGDLAFACFTTHTTVPALLDCAPTLAAFEAELNRATAFTTKVGNEQNAAIMAEFAVMHRALASDANAARTTTDLTANPMAAAYRHTTRALLAAFFGDSSTLVAAAAGIEATLPFVSGNYFSATAQFARVLALLAERRFADADPVMQWLAARAADAPANFDHLVLHLRAERAWAAGDESAGPLFDAALRAVARRRRPWHHAFLAERAARFHLSEGMEYVGHRLLRDAQEHWRDWGADAKAAAQEREFPFLRERRTAALAASVASTTMAAEAVDLMAVVEASRALSSETRIDRLRIRVVEILSTLTGATKVHLLTRDDGEGDWTDGGVAITPQRVPLSIVRYAERTRTPLVLDNAVDDPRFAQDPYLDGLDLYAALAVTVLSHGEPRAMLVLENRLWRGTFTEERLDAVRIIASQLIVSIENATLYASLEQKVAERTEQLRLANAQLEILSGTDPLTGIANRRRLDRELDLAWQSAAGEPLAVAMIDIDHFKLYNDRLGHAAGDGCLRVVARTIARVVRDEGLVARYGGEEFTIVLPRTGAAAAVAVAERVQQAIHAAAQPHPAAPSGLVTVSVGVSCEVPSSGRRVADLIADADAGLYEAKHAGRNQVRFAGRAVTGR
ncbi:diguanylate cyclase [Actinoplanes sp. LDG1-06]|uniref:Diguanylate cyclase n=1 Tax=Paractinoplanes ovalisporus TaxID=2810368 RepID=A0ABS2A4V4_9ACTN|nr:diguanylate cyclase [Actinoplanes ovalisporus]MBM2614837.1 diguanylate cyclase [Actinoplanes ovalisporus]